MLAAAKGDNVQYDQLLALARLNWQANYKTYWQQFKVKVVQRAARIGSTIENAASE